MSGRPSSTVLVGRGEYLAMLDAALARARDEVPSTVFSGGEAGVGKTRLTSKFAAHASDAGTRVLAGACLDMGAEGLPFAPLSAMLRELVRDMGADGVARLLPGHATREVARLLPEFGAAERDTDASAARARLFEQMLALLERLADERPVLLIIEEELLSHDGELNAELPESLRDLLLAAVRRLPEETQDILRAASAAGPGIEHSLLAAVTGLEEDALARALRPAVAANVLVVRGDGYAFRHALIREAVYDDLLPGERTRRHTKCPQAHGAAAPGQRRLKCGLHRPADVCAAVRGRLLSWRARRSERRHQGRPVRHVEADREPECLPGEASGRPPPIRRTSSRMAPGTA
jgi:predicted ATPase